jgi:hypothetical protein
LHRTESGLPWEYVSDDLQWNRRSQIEHGGDVTLQPLGDLHRDGNRRRYLQSNKCVFEYMPEENSWVKNSCSYDLFTRILSIGQARDDGIDQLSIETGDAVDELSPE